MKKAYSEIHPLSKIGVTALVALLSLLVFLIIASVLAIPIFGIDAFSSIVASSVDFSPQNLALLKYIQIAQSVGMFIVPSFILAILFGGKAMNYLKLDKVPFLTSIVLSIVIVMSASPLINLIGVWNMEMSLPTWMSGLETWMRESEDAAQKITELFVNVSTTKGLLFNIVMIGLIPALGEELLFRGVIQRIFTDWTKNKHVAIWVTAILFSALHMQFYGFLPRALLGAMFGYLLVWSKNLWLPVIAHFVNNTTAVIAYYLYNTEVISVDPDAIGTNSEYGIAGLASLVIVVLLFTYYYRYEKQRLKNYA